MHKESTMKRLTQTWIGFYRYRNLLKQLVVRDIKLKYRRSVLGYFWSVLNPLLIMLIMVAVFSSIFRSDVENFPLYLLSGQILFNYFSDATNGAIQSVTGAGGLMKKAYVPKYIFTLSKVTSTLVTMLLSMIALILVAVVTKAPVSWKYVFICIPVLELYLFCAGMGLFLAQAAVFFRDVQYIFSVLLTGWMYLTPIFYPVKILPDTLAFVVTRLNPMSLYIEQFRLIVMYGMFPAPRLALYGLICAFAALVPGVLFFWKNQDRFILYI